jgi:hypothetical protein
LIVVPVKILLSPTTMPHVEAHVLFVNINKLINIIPIFGLYRDVNSSGEITRDLFAIDKQTWPAYVLTWQIPSV